MTSSQLVRRVLVATDRSRSADFAVGWAAEMAGRYGAELVLLQVLVPQQEPGATTGSRASYAAEGLMEFARELAGERGRAEVVAGEDVAGAIVEAAERLEVDVIVVGNLGMTGRKEFLLGNVPNRVSHNAACTVVIVNSAPAAEQPSEPGKLSRLFRRDT